MSGREHGWRRSDVPLVIEAARTAGLAQAGGVVQFVFPNGTCELYWCNFDPTRRLRDEPWSDYVDRSAVECLVDFERLLASTDIADEARRAFAFVREKDSEGVDISRCELFLLYFDDGSGGVGEPA